jgi:aldehyde dehydrogenase (NAD+)
MEPSIDLNIESSIAEAFQLHKDKVKLLRTESVSDRKKRLRKLRQWIHTNRTALHEAMYADFRKHPTEVDGIEIFHVLSEIKKAVDNLDLWAAPKKVDAPLTMLGTRSYVKAEPRGVCLIISPWNYPFSLCAGPLVSALAAGNAVALKPSELTPHVSAALKRMVTEVFDPAVVSIHEGGPEVSQALLKLPFDHIFFTGSPAVGKIVMKAASENLTSVTLELGGKSPVIVSESAYIKEAAERVAVAKFVNNGQTCIAPDYVLVDRKIADPFISELIAQTKKLFAGKDQSFENSENYCRIVNDRHFLRLNNLLQDAIERGATLAWGGNVNASDRFIHPTILTNVSLSSNIMEDEIFGPILPVISYQNLEKAIEVINEKPKPLALYVFSKNKKINEKVLEETSSGGACVNDCAIHFLHSNLPFGGVNNSGIGKSHGHHGFLAFSNEKPVLKQRSGVTSVRAFYPPYTTASKRIMDWFLKLF